MANTQHTLDGMVHSSFMMLVPEFINWTLNQRATSKFRSAARFLASSNNCFGKFTHYVGVSVSILCSFPQVKIQLLEDSMDAPKCLEYAFPGAQKRALKYPLVINPKGTYQYFEAKKGFSIFRLLKNPMVILMLFSVGLMVAMPYMMEGLDPEEKARMREQMKNQQDPTAMLSQMWGDLTGGEEEAPKSKKERRKIK